LLKLYKIEDNVYSYEFEGIYIVLKKYKWGDNSNRYIKIMIDVRWQCIRNIICMKCKKVLLIVVVSWYIM
jgi:hypothetical protein